MNTSRTHKSARTRSGAVSAGLLTAIAAFGYAPATASALPPEPFPEAIEDTNAVVPMVEGVFVPVIPTEPSAEIVVDCDATDHVSVNIGNHTTSSFIIETSVDGDFVDSAWVDPDEAHAVALAPAENETHDVVVRADDDLTLLEQAVTLDCLLPAPSYEVIQDCDTHQAHARLVNDGDDTAWMGVQYPEVMHMEIEIPPHSSEDWLLVTPGPEPVEFEVVSSGMTIGTEVFEFSCPVTSAPTPSPAPAPTPAPVEPAAATVTTAGAGDAVPVPVDLSVDPAENRTAEVTDQPAAAEIDLAAPVALELSGSEHSFGLAIAMALVLIGLTMLGGVVLAFSRDRRA